MELQILIHICNYHFSPSETILERIHEFNEIDWQKIFDLATKHRVRPLLYHGLIKLENKVAIDEKVLKNLQQFQIHLTRFNLNHAKELQRVIKEFKEEGVTVYPYKGVVLANYSFQAIGLREFTDIDLLVRKQDLRTIQNQLIADGYEMKNQIPQPLLPQYLKNNCEFNFELFEGEKRLFHIEPHWFLGQRMLQLNIDVEDLKIFLVERKLFNQTLKTFDCNGMLMLVCVHHVGKEEWFSLKHIYDIVAIVQNNREEIDWEQLLVISSKLGITNILLYGLGIANQIFNLDLPSEIMKRIEQPKMADLIRSGALKMEQANYQNRSKRTFTDRMWFHFKLRRSWSTKSKILYFHFLQILLPNENDFSDTEYSIFQYVIKLATKPFRMWNQYLR